MNRKGIYLLSLIALFVFTPSLAAETEWHLGGYGLSTYNILNKDVGANQYRGKFSFGGGGFLELIYAKHLGIEAGFGYNHRRFKITNGSFGVTFNQDVKGFRVPVIGRFYFGSFAAGVGFFYDFISTQGCFDDNDDYGYIIDVRYAPYIMNSVRLLLDIQYVHGSKTCGLFGNKDLSAINAVIGLSIKFK